MKFLITYTRTYDGMFYNDIYQKEIECNKPVLAEDVFYDSMPTLDEENETEIIQYQIKRITEIPI